MIGDVYVCPRCHDEMSLRFAKSHERICRWHSEFISEEIDREW